VIWHPTPGQRVRLHYARHYAAMMPCHGRSGTVQVVSAGAKLVNALVELDSGRVVVVPRGNLEEENT